MDAAGKGKMRIIPAVKAEFIRLVEHRRVTVGRPHTQRDQRPLGPMPAPHLETGNSPPVAQLVGAFHAQDFLNGRRP